MNRDEKFYFFIIKFFSSIISFNDIVYILLIINH